MVFAKGSILSCNKEKILYKIAPLILTKWKNSFPFSSQLCPEGTYNNVTGASSEDACLDCPAGYWCPDPGIEIYTNKCTKGRLKSGHHT